MSTRAHWLERAQAQAWWPEGWKPDADAEPSPWLAALVMLGAVLCSVPLLAFLMIGLEDLLLRTAAAYVVGLLGMLGALWWMRAPRHIFSTCIALEVWGLGLALVVIRWLEDTRATESAALAASAFTSAALLGSAMLISALWVCRLLGFALAPALLATLVLAFNVAGLSEEIHLTLAPAYLLLVALGWMLWCRHEERWLGRPGATRIAALADGFAVGLLLAAAWSATWLHMPWRSFMQEAAGSTLWIHTALRGLSTFAVLTSGWVLARRWSARGAQGWPRLLALSCLVLALGAWFSPALGAVALVAATAAASARWRLLALSGLAALSLLSSFYYHLAWPLAAKGIGLALLGAALAVSLMAMRSHGASRSQQGGLKLSGPRRGVAWVMLGAVIALGLANADVWRKEAVIAHGQRILVQLAPVDPRSLMQGDYMQLRFAIPQNIQEALAGSSSLQLAKHALVVAELDSSDEARLLRLANPGESLAPQEILLPLKHLKGAWVLVTDAYFFPEGQAARFEQAGFGEFRVLADGRALLVGLADTQGKAIETSPALSAPTESESEGQR